jgi:uncharacterized protein (DUF1330 family)
MVESDFSCERLKPSTATTATTAAARGENQPTIGATNKPR